MTRPVLTIGPTGAYGGLQAAVETRPVSLVPWRPQTLLCVPTGYRGATMTPGCYELLAIHVDPEEEPLR